MNAAKRIQVVTITCLFFLATRGWGASLLPYDEKIADTASTYTVHNNNYQVLVDKNISVEGRIMEARSDENEYDVDRYSVILDIFNIFNVDEHGYGNRFTQIVFPLDVVIDQKNSQGKKILVRGNVAAAGLSKEYFNGTRLPFIQFEHCTIWLEP